MLSEEEWNSTLTDNNFSGTEISLSDCEGPDPHTHSVMVSSTIDPNLLQKSRDRTTFIVSAEEDCLQWHFAVELANVLEKAGKSDIHITSSGDLLSKNLDDTVCIFLQELHKPYLANIGEPDFASLKKMVSGCHAIIWVTKGTGDSPNSPELDLVSGFGRNARLENWGLNFVHLGVDKMTAAAGIVDHIIKVYQEVATGTYEYTESVYREENGKLHIGRVVEAAHFNELVETKVARHLQPKTSTLGQSDDRALLLSIGTPGLLDSLLFVDDDGFAVPLATNEIEIQPKAVGLNFKDVLIALGSIAGSNFGHECAGVVSRVGPGAGFEVGDRVWCCTSSGTFQTHVRTPSCNAAKIKDDMSFNSAASIPLVFCTAYYALYHVARLREGESILIHSGAGGVGQAAIQLAKLRKANVFTTAGTTEKKDLLINQFGIPKTQIFSSRKTSFEKAIKRLTRGVGVDVVINSLSGDLMRASWSCIAPFGRFIELGKTDIMSGRGLSMDPFLKNVTFSSVDLAVVMRSSKSLMSEITKTIEEFLGNGAISLCQPLHVYGLSEIEKAFRFMQSGKNMGKIVIEMDQSASVKVCCMIQLSWVPHC